LATSATRRNGREGEASVSSKGKRQAGWAHCEGVVDGPSTKSQWKIAALTAWVDNWFCGGLRKGWWRTDGVKTRGRRKSVRDFKGGVLDGGPRGGGECGSWPQPVDGVTAAQE
jgi:hypothetical protein